MARVNFIPGEIIPCNVTGPKGYRCTIECGVNKGDRIDHNGPHVAKAIIGTDYGSDVVTWGGALQAPVWNPEYHGR